MAEKIIAIAIKGADDPEVAVASSGAIDRDGEIIDPKGWDLKNYKKLGMPIQADHNSSVFSTIGNAMWIKVSGDKLIFKPKFHELTPAGWDAKALWDNGIVKSFSVGFIPKEWEEGGEKDKFRRKYTKQELLEISFTPVPSNPEAHRSIAKAFNEGVIKDVDFAEYLAPGSTKEIEEEVEPEEIEEIKEEVEVKPEEDIEPTITIIDDTPKEPTIPLADVERLIEALMAGLGNASEPIKEAVKEAINKKKGIL